MQYRLNKSQAIYTDVVAGVASRASRAVPRGLLLQTYISNVFTPFNVVVVYSSSNLQTGDDVGSL